jgi:hypothetical protein
LIARRGFTRHQTVAPVFSICFLFDFWFEPKLSGHHNGRSFSLPIGGLYLSLCVCIRMISISQCARDLWRAEPNWTKCGWRRFYRRRSHLLFGLDDFSSSSFFFPLSRCCVWSWCVVCAASSWFTAGTFFFPLSVSSPSPYIRGDLMGGHDDDGGSDSTWTGNVLVPSSLASSSSSSWKFRLA